MPRQLCASLAGQMRARRLRFGDRVLCPFLRPFFLEADDEARVRSVVELLWTLGERVARAAVDNPAMLSRPGAERGRRSVSRGSIPAIRRRAPRRARTRSSSPTRCSSRNTTANRRPAPATVRGWRAVRRAAADGAVSRAVRRAHVHAGRAAARGARSRATANGAARRRRHASPSSTCGRSRPSASSRSCGMRSWPRVCRRSICDPRDLDYRPADGSSRPASASIWCIAASSSTTSSRAKTSAARCSTRMRTRPSASPIRSAARFRTRRRSLPC